MLLYIKLLLILINLALISIVYKGQRSYTAKMRPLEISYIGFVLSVSAWILIQISYDYLAGIDQLRLLQLSLDVGLVLSLMISMSFWRFMSEFSGRGIVRSKLLTHLSIGGSMLIVGLILRPVYVFTNSMGKIEYGYKTTIYSLITLYVMSYFVSGLWALFKHNKNKQPSEAHSRNKKSLTLSVIAALLGILIGNVILPIVSTDSVLTDKLSEVFLIFGTTLISLSAAFSAFNLGAFDFRRFLFRAALSVLSLVLPILGILYLLAFGASYVLEATGQSFSSTIGRLIYVFSVCVGIGLVIVFRKYFIRWFNHLFYKNYISEQDFAYSVEQLIKSEFSDKLTSKYAELCKKYLNVDKVIVFVGGKHESDLSEQKSIGVSKRLLNGDATMVQLFTELENQGRKKSSSLGSLVEDVKLDSDSDVNYAIKYEQSILQGAIFLGSKLNGRRYYAEEVNALRKSLVEILLAMQNVFRLKQLIEFNQSLEERIIQATKELRHTNDKLRALDEAKDEFISMASHQLRTPLTSIKGYISLILDGDMGKVPIKQRKMLSEAFSSSQRMVYLIADLLNVSRLKTGKFIIEAGDVYLPDLIEEEIDQVREMAEVKNIKIHYEKPKSFDHLQLDDMKIRQVIMNFIDNAIHYTPEDGDISVQLLDTGKSVEFKVHDSGIGVPKTEQHHLFTKFYRAGNARKARPDGTGLGLFMAKKVIIASGGSLIFNSIEGKGSTFGFVFPKPKK